jgi:carboxyl-terminal processing protease
MRYFLRVFLIFFFWTHVHAAGIPSLKKSDVRSTLEEIFTYHIEHKSFTPLLVKRSFKLYIEQFDPERIYLLQNEVKPFLELSKERIEAVIEKYHADDFSEYEALDAMIQKAIKRAQKWRLELRAEVKPALADSYPSFAANESQLKERMRAQVEQLLFLEKFSGELTKEKRNKFFKFSEKRFQRNESEYLVQGEKKEHCFVLHLLKALARSLDAHTAYFSPEEAFEMRTLLEKQFEGIGIVLRESIDGVTVAGFIKNGPAEKSGKIAVGDLLVGINEKALKDISYEEILKRMKGKRGEKIFLKFQRLDQSGGGTTFDVELIREKILMEEERVSYSSFPCADGHIGKIDLPSFYESGDGSSCEQDVREALKELKKKGKILGLVIDMRENAGGFLNQAVKVAGLFITSGVVVISKYAHGQIQYLRDVDGRAYYTGPLLILTSKASASAAEIVAGALQDYGTALIVGDERTYGKGSIQYQTLTDEYAKAFFKVTVGKYYTVSGKSTQIEGVKADIVVPTNYFPYHIGEKFLEYALTNDRMPPAYLDSLSDLQGQTRQWFQKNYLPYLHKKETFWRKMLTLLKENSSYRLLHDKNFSLYLQALTQSNPVSTTWGLEDLQMAESVAIIRDMLSLQTQKSFNVK